MTVTITIDAPDAVAARAEMASLIYGTSTVVPMPAVSDVSSDTPKSAADTDGEPAGTQAPKPRGRKPKAETAKLPEGPALNVVANISTGDERVDPEATEQDKADEAVDLTPYAEPEAKVYTIDDVRHAATPYIRRHTMALAQIDLQDCLEAAVGIRQISKLNTADQAQLKKAAEAFDAAGKAEARFVKAA